MLNHLKLILRRMRRAPLFTAITLLTLAIGIGANTAIFTIVNAVMLRPLPYPQPDSLIGVWQSAAGVNISQLNASPSTYFLYREENRSFEDIGLWRASSSSITGTAQPEQVRSLEVTDGVLPLLRAVAGHGRLFTKADDLPGRPRTAILSAGYFARKFGSDPKAIGQRLLVDGRAVEIIGVLPAAFRFLDSDADLILPFQFNRNEVFVGNFSYQALARLKPGVSIEQASADVGRMIPMLTQRFKLAPGMSPKIIEETKMAPLLRPLKNDVIGDIGNVLWVLMATVGIVLFIACANVANLLLVKAAGRQQELATRAALGADRWDIARELLYETVVFGLLGGALGVGLAYAGVKLSIWLAPTNFPRLAEISIDPYVLLFALGISLLAGISFGLVPVLKYAGPQLQNALRSGSRNFSEGKQRHRTRDTLVVIQVTLALVLLIGSALMIRTAVALRSVAPGFSDPEHIVTMRIGIPEAQIPEPARAAQMQQDIARKLSEIAGVSSVGISTAVTMDDNRSFDPVNVEDHPVHANKIPKIRRHTSIGPGYFKTMGNPIAAGRDFTWEDLHKMRPVAIVSKNLALEYWPTPAAALGKRISERNGGSWREIVGVAGDDRSEGVDRAAPPTAYWPLLKTNFWQEKVALSRYVGFVVRSPRSGTAAFTADIQRAVWSVNPQLPVANVRTVQELYSRSMSRTSFTLAMLSLSAGMALLLGVIGIYGVISYSIAQRTREIGIRMALGAQQSNVRRMFLGHGVLLASIGIACGFAIAVPLTRYMSSLLFEISPTDPATYAAVAAFLLAAAALAAYLPARRASRIAPVDALRG